MHLWVSSLGERLRSSLFFLPMVAVLVAVVAGLAGVRVDEWLDDPAEGLPLVLTSTVDSARAILTTVAAATISFAGIAFSISLLVIQLTSSQYSPRVVTTLFRDPFNKRVMALVVGTFTYCVVVLRSVRSEDAAGDAVVPNLSVTVAVVLGISAILATVAFINHSAHSMDVSEVLARASSDAVDHIREDWVMPGEQKWSHDGSTPLPRSLGAPPHLVRFEESGWVQQIDLEALVGLLPAGAVMELRSVAGRYAVPGTPLCAVYGLDGFDADGVDEFDRSARRAVALGTSRTMQQDVSYGLRQIVDVALRGLSPGVNDPTTAQDAIFHATAVLVELLRRDPPAPPDGGEDGGTLVLAEQPTHEDLVRLTFDEVRRAAVDHPTVCLYLLEALHLVRQALDADGLHDRAPELEEQARLIVEGSDRSGALPEDHARVARSYARRFPSTVDGGQRPTGVHRLDR